MGKSLEEEIMIKAREARPTAKYMASLDDLVEERIRKAREEGAFDNLEGHGKPLELYENPFEPPEMRMVYKLLKDAGFSPFWIEQGKDVDASIEKFWEDVEKFKTRLRVIKSGSKWGLKRNNPEKLTQRFYAECREKLQDINKKIDNYNIHCPMWWMGRGRISVNQEMAKVEEALRQEDSRS